MRSNGGGVLVGADPRRHSAAINKQRYQIKIELSIELPSRA